MLKKINNILGVVISFAVLTVLQTESFNLCTKEGSLNLLIIYSAFGYVLISHLCNLLDTK